MPASPAAEKIALWRSKPQVFVREVFGATPDPWQDDALEIFPYNPRLALKASKGPGKGAPKSLILNTPSGVRRWGDIKPGDLVFAPDGSPTVVAQTFDLGIRQLYRVSFDDGSSTLVTADHLWKVRGQAERARKCAAQYRRETASAEIWSVLSTEEIVARGVRVKNGRWAGRQFEIPLHDPVQYPEVALPIDPYLVGVWIGDGSRGQATYFKPYPEVEDEIIRRGYKTSRKGGTVRILESTEAFKKLECFDCYSQERFIPEEFKSASVEQRRDMLCGLMDTDGCIGSEGSMEYDTTSPRLAEDVVWIVRSLGGNAFVKAGIKRGWYHDDDGNRVDCRDCYRVTIRTTFNPFRIPHKAERWKDPMRSKSSSRYLTRYIDSIEPEGEEDSMCIAVEHPSHCYLANDFIVTHNTCLLAWLAWNFLLTRPHPNIAATSISADNLKDNLWKECAVWMNKSKLLQDQFVWQKERIFAKDYPATWFMSARSWPKAADQTQLGNTLAGLHSDYIMFLLDESGGMPNEITQSAEAALSSCKEGHIVQAGNTNSLEGALYTACVKQGHLWKVIVISGDPDDPKRSSRVSIEWAREQIKTYGRDNPFVKVMILGEWPAASLNALIGPDEVEAAMRRTYRETDYCDSAKVLGVDVAYFGDDASVVFPRQGIQAFPPLKYRNLMPSQGAGAVARKWRDWGADACFIDMTGGFGTGWFDSLQQLNLHPIGVQFSQAANDAKRYVNKRAEMYFEAVQWIRNGGALPPIPELTAALTQTTYTFQRDRLLLEPKEDIKLKLGYSPDDCDSFVLGFAEPVMKAARQVLSRPQRDDTYDPIGDALRAR